ncbi:hypothetical protein Syun_028278 [Stephania yunnanensis]|uniref:Uncharacterized protein n=1 Tax=Stephania yunnanensis TaxID=152371 RepID=A0AAP0EKG7_9MAGN
MLHNILSSSRALSSSPGCSSLTFEYVEFKYDIKAINMIIAAVAIESLPESDDEDVQR